MSEQPHVIVVSLEDPDVPESIIRDVLHPTDCPWSISWVPTASRNLGDVTVDHSYEYRRRYDCALAWSIEHDGGEGLPTVPGAYWVGTWLERYPSGPWGPAEYDGGIVWQPMASPTFVVSATDAPEIVGHQREGFGD